VDPTHSAPAAAAAARGIFDMRLILAEDYDDLSDRAARLLADAIAAKPDLALVPATGDTPMGAYARLAAIAAAEGIATARLRVFQLDEYLGLPAGDRRLLAGWMERALIRPLAIPEDRVVRFDSDAPDPAMTCAAWDAALADAGGADLVVLGLGPNGHLGFNEPPTARDAPTRAVDLTPESIRSNGPYWGGEEFVPRRAVTAGMAPLLAARRVLLLVAGERKHGILHRALGGEATPGVPGSWLRTAAADVVVIADRAAWGNLPVPASLVEDDR
jgi:glucosamine-6-phosphate deaminase